MPPDAPATPETGATTTTTNPAPNIDPQATPPAPPAEPKVEQEPEDVSGLKAALKAERDARKHAEGRVKELTPFEQAAKDAEEANKSEIQKVNESLQTERDARSKAESQLLRYEVGTTKGVPAKLIKFLSGATKAEVEQAADDLLAELGTTKPSMPGRPQERMANGQPSKGGLDNEDPMTLIAMGRGQKTS